MARLDPNGLSKLWEFIKKRTPVVVQATGASEKAVMSQKAVTEAVGNAVFHTPQTLSDAQKSQARSNIDAIDKAYAETNFAGKTEFNSLKETVDALAPSGDQEVESVISYSYETAEGSGYLFHSDGTPQTGIAPYKYTVPVPVTANSSVEYKIKGTSAIAVVAFFDVNNTYISGVAGTGATVEDTAEVPENAAYVIFSFSASGQYGLVRTLASGEIIKKSTRYYNVKGTASSDTDIASTDLGFYNMSGEFLSSGGYSYVPKFKVSGVVTGFLSYNGAYNLTGVARVAFYDKNEVFISAINMTQDAGDELFIAPSGTAYLALSFSDAKTGDYTIINEFETQESASMDGLQEWLEQAKQELNPLYGKKLVVTGDSITQGGSLPNGSYATMIAADNNMTFQNKAIWGAVMATGVVSGGKTLDSIYPTIAQMDADADYIIISGGVNDFSYMQMGNEPVGAISKYYEGLDFDTTTYCGALEQMCRDALVKWAGKKVLFVIEHRTNSMQFEDTEGTHDYLVKNTYMPLTKRILEKWGMPYVDLYTSTPTLANISYLKENYTIGDGWHPNEAGYRAYYIPQIVAKLKSI